MHPLKREFIQLFEASGWNQAECARRLRLTRGGLNGIITGDTTPHEATILLFRMILEKERPEVLRGNLRMGEGTSKPLPPEELAQRELMEELERVPASERKQLITALHGIVKAFPRGSKPAPRPATVAQRPRRKLITPPSSKQVADDRAVLEHAAKQVAGPNPAK